HASEMMRWASCLGFENHVPLCCPVHDAFVCEGRIDDEERIVSTLSACMERASAIVLGGRTVRAKPVVFRHPDRFADRKGWPAWGGDRGRWGRGTGKKAGGGGRTGRRVGGRGGGGGGGGGRGGWGVVGGWRGRVGVELRLAVVYRVRDRPKPQDSNLALHP